MIEPYKSIITDLEKKLSSLGFRILRDSDDGVILGDGIRSIDISTDMRNPREMTIGVTDTYGTNRSLFVLERMLDSSTTECRTLETRKLAEELGIETRPLQEIVDDGSLFKYLHFGLNWTLDFVAAHFKEIFEPSDEVRNNYAQASRSALASLGIKI